MLEPEDDHEVGPSSVPMKKTFDCTDADRLVAFAEAHHMKVRGHNLAWETYTPNGWQKVISLTSNFATFCMSTFTVCLHTIAGKVFALGRGQTKPLTKWPVCVTPSGTTVPELVLREKGPAYIEQAFRGAREADPHALLFYNDAEAEIHQPKI